MKVVIIEKDALFYTYSNLETTLIKTGDVIQPNQLIGYAAFDLDKYKPTVELYISNGEAYMELTKADFIKRFDKPGTGLPIDTDKTQ